MPQDVNDRSWVKEFYDSAADWWGESWYEGENLAPRLAQVEKYIGKPPKTLLELGAGTGETAGFLAAAGYDITAVDLSDKNFSLLQKACKTTPRVTAIHGDFLTAVVPGHFDAVGRGHEELGRTRGHAALGGAAPTGVTVDGDVGALGHPELDGAHPLLEADADVGAHPKLRRPRTASRATSRRATPPSARTR